jgi:hypothetical protein
MGTWGTWLEQVFMQSQTSVIESAMVLWMERSVLECYNGWRETAMRGKQLE